MGWAQALQIAGSLVAIFALAGLARWLRLGGDVRIISDDAALVLAGELVPGFSGVAVARDRAGCSALVRGADGGQALIFRHGANFVARRLSAGVEARLDQALLTIALPDRGIAPVTLNLGAAAQHWAAGLRHLPVSAARG